MARSMNEECENKIHDVVNGEDAARLEFEEYRAELRNITNELFIEPLSFAIKQKDDAIEHRFVGIERGLTDLRDLANGLDRKSDAAKELMEIGRRRMDDAFGSMRNEHEQRFEQFRSENNNKIKNLNTIGVTALIMASVIIALQLYIIFAR